MKDGLDYAEMLGLEVSSCDVTIKPKKTKRKKDVIGDVIKKVNEPEKETNFDDDYQTIEIPEKTNKKKERKFRFDLVYAEGVAVFLLVVTILLTNIFWENSGIIRHVRSGCRYESQHEFQRESPFRRTRRKG